MAIANIIGLYILLPVVKKELTHYWARLEAGELRKVRTGWLIHTD
jgi:AGCS family alanine or glycine:cation symporter